MKKYTHLLFDLDHTLWDFDTNCRLTLEQLHRNHKLNQYQIDIEEMYQKYMLINNKVWGLYDQNMITKEELRSYRFKNLLEQFGVTNNELASKLEIEFLATCPKQGHLLPFAEELVKVSKSKFNICLISNGFQETQELKVNHSNLKGYFDFIFTSESTKHKKPNIAFFNHVLETLQVTKEQCLIIGDNPHTDIQGAKNAGIDSAWINTQKFPKNMTSTYYFDDVESFLRILKH